MRRSLTKDERLTGRAEIQRLFRHGRSFRGTGVLMKLLENGLDHNRAVVVPPRKSGTKVTKNRLRRVGRETYRQLKPELEQGYDLVFVVYPEFQDFTSSQRLDALREVLEKAALIRQSGH